MREKGFEMIRCRPQQFTDRIDPIPDKTKSVTTHSATVRLQEPMNKFESREDTDSLAAMRYRALKNARDTLIALIERDVDGLSIEKEARVADLIEKQTEIVENLRAKWNALFTNAEEDGSQVDTNTGVPNDKITDQPIQKSKRKCTATRRRSLSPEDSASTIRRSSRSKKSKIYTPPSPSPSTAFPVSAPTTLPAELRSRKNLTVEDVAGRSMIHPSFDESMGKKIDKHSRRINCTSGKGMAAGMKSNVGEVCNRAMEERIRVPSDSPEGI